MYKATIEDVRCISASDKALRCRLPDGRRVWVPLSAIHDDSEVYKLEHYGKLVIKGWFAEQINVELD